MARADGLPGREDWLLPYDSPVPAGINLGLDTLMQSMHLTPLWALASCRRKRPESGTPFPSPPAPPRL